MADMKETRNACNNLFGKKPHYRMILTRIEYRVKDWRCVTRNWERGRAFVSTAANSEFHRFR